MSPSDDRPCHLGDQMASASRKHFDGLVAQVVEHATRSACRDCIRAIQGLRELQGVHCPEIDWVDEWPTEKKLEAKAGPIAQKLVSLSPERRRLYLDASDSTRSRPVVEALLEEAKSHLSTDSDLAVKIAELARQIVDSIDPERYHEALWFELRSRVLAGLANALRRTGDLRAAAHAIARAELALLLSTENPGVVALVARVKARVLRDQGAFSDALSWINDAIGLYQANRFAQELGIALYERSKVLASLERYQESVADHHSALLYIDLEEAPRLGFVVLHSMALRYTALGRMSQALHALDESVRVGSRAMNEGDWIRVAWARGRIHVAQDDLVAAEVEFADARDRFVASGHPLDAALVSLELAIVLAERGRFEEVAALASEMHAAFRAAGVPREARAAAHLLREATTVEAVRRVAATVSRLKSSGPSSASDH